MFFVLFCLINYYTASDAFQPYKQRDQIFTPNVFKSILKKMNTDYIDQFSDISSTDSFMRTPLESTIEYENEPDYYSDVLEDDPVVPNLRGTEYSEQNPLWYQQFIAGSLDGKDQNFNPEGTMFSTNEDKPDIILPAYCNPPNPCPVGFTSNDGCIQVFENTAAFSQKYQAAQNCMCDKEHMFRCPSTLIFPYRGMAMNSMFNGDMLPIAAKKGINVDY